MSTLSGVSSKGEKGKPKFQSLDINSLYHKSSKGESSEQHQTKSTVPRKHGMQSLGKVPSTRRAPVNLPSLKSEHSGSDPTVSLVPTGGTGWGSKASDAPPITSTSPVSTTSGPTPGTNAPAVVGTAPVPQTNITPTPPQPPKPVVSVGGDKTWSSVMVGGEGGSGGVSLGGGNGPSFLAHQSPQFQAEFPSLLGEGGVPGPPPQGGEGGYGPGPSLRPQTEGSWAHGGGYQAPPPTQDTQPRPLTQFPPPVSTPNIVPQYKGVVPSFMLNSRSGSGSNSSTDVSGGVGVGGGGNIGKFPGSIFPSNFPNPPPIRPSNKFHGSTEVRYSGSRPPPTADPEEMMPRPIIREEDLNRMDEISRDTGWATQDDIDYDQKLAFSDDESTGNDDEKDKVKSLSLQSKEEKKDIDNEKENREKINMNERLTDKSNHPWQGRSTANIPAPDFRSTHSRMPHPNAREMEMDDVWREKRRQTSEQVAAVAEKAKQRKEEEEKRFEETRSKTENERKKKEDTENDWDKDEKKDISLIKEVAAETFRQMTHLESRNYPRQEPQQSYSRYPNPLLPPRFQKQQNIRQQQQSGSSENRWGNNQHFPSNKQRIRGDNDENKEKEDERDKRERNTPEPSERFRSGSIRNDRSYDNRKSGYYDNQHDYNRGYHRDNDQERDRNKETESRMRDRENEVEWDNRRMGGSAWDGNRNFEDNKPLGRRDNKKPNEGYNKPHSGLFDERDNDWRERPENRDRPVRPDSRDSRASRDSRTSREDTRSIQDPVNNDYSWADGEFEKEIHEERPRRKENYKEDRRETQPSRREGYVPGPITKEKMEAYEHKHNLAQYIKQEKKELLSSVSLESKNNEEDSWKKTDLSNNVSWADSADDNSGQQQQQQPSLAQNKGASESTFSAPAPGSADDNSSDRASIKEEVTVDKKKDISITSNINASSNKDKGMGAGRGTGRSSGPGGGRGGGGNWQHYSNNYVCYRGSGSWGNNKDTNSRKGISKSGKQWIPASDSEPSGDEISASTESGKEDKKIERKQPPRSPKSGERKRDKDDRIRDPKKNEPNEKSVGGNMNRKSQQQQHLQQNTSQHQSNQAPQGQVQTTNMSSQNQQQGGAYDTGGGRKEGFQPRGEPSRRGRGGFRVSGGRGPHIGAHYGPPGSKPAFPTPPPTNKEEEVADSSSEEKKRPIITGRKDQRKGDSDGNRSSKTKTGKLKREQEEWETTSEGSDSEAKGKQQRHLNKKNSQRLNNDKRGPFNSSQINGRPSRLEECKIDERLNKEDDDNSHLTNHTDVYHTNNGFQEVKSKKTGKDNRPLSKEELKKNRGKDKGKGPQGGNSKGSQNKNFTREWSNKPPRMQRMAAAYLQQQQQQGHQEVSDMNKLNHQNISMFPIRTEVNCPAPAPPPPVNAWDKPITAALRTTPPPANLQHLAPSIANSQDKNVIELNDHGQSGTSSQTSSPSAEKALSKMGREAVEKSLLDGTTPPVQTIIFENTNYKVAPNDMNMKTKYPIKGQRIDKGRVERKLDEELEDGAHLGLGFKPGNELKPGENKPQEPIQMPMSFSKSEDNADMKLDFAFDSDLTQLTDDKSNIPRSIHQGLGQNSDAELNEKIASVKKVWETPGSMMEHQHHDEVVSTSSSFTPNFGSAVDTSLDHSSVHQVDDTTFATPDVYAHQNPSTNRTNYFIITGPQMQGSAPGYASGGANIIKQDPSNATSNVCKVKPQPQQAVISSAIGTHSGGPSLSSPPPPFTQGHFNYQTQYSNIPAIPSPPAVLINSPAGGQQVPPSHQGELYHSFPIGGPTVIGSQQARSGFSQFPYGLGQSLGGTSAFSQQSLYHLPQAAPPNPPPDVFQSISQYRIQPSAYGQSQQLSNSPSTVLITSSSNSLMSASVKSSPQPPPIGAIGSKGAYQSSAVPSQVQLGFIPYDATQILPQSFLQNSQLVQRHGANNVVPAIQPPTSFYSGSAGGQTGLFQPGSSILAGGGSQPAALHNAATAFGMQGFGAQSTAPAQPASNNPVGVPYSSQMGHFRGQAPAAYLKAAGGNPVTGQHASDPAKSPSTNQDINSVFSTGGGGQIPSPKSRNAGNSGAGGKQSQTPQQPSPTQGHHKFTAYPAQSNLVIQGGGNNNPQQQLGGRGGVPPVPQGVRTGNNNGNGLGGNAGVARYPTPIQRPPSYPGLQPQRHRVQQSRPQPVSQQQHLQKITSQYYQQQGNAVKLDVEGKNEGDKLQEQTNPGNTKQEKKEETTNSSEQ